MGERNEQEFNLSDVCYNLSKDDNISQIQNGAYANYMQSIIKSK